MAAVVVLILIASAARKAVAEAGHVLSVVLEVLAVVVIAAAAAAVLVVLVLACVRLRRWRTARRGPHTHAPETIRARAEISVSEPRAIEAPKRQLLPLVMSGQLAEVPREEG